MLVLNSNAAPHHTPARAKEVFDVSGAGDTAIAVLTLAFCAGATAAEAAELANVASGVAIGKVGTATVTPDELQAELSKVELPGFIGRSVAPPTPERAGTNASP